MEKALSNLKLATFNCRSVKSSVNEVYRLCDDADTVILQEHWLLPNELSMLNMIHPNFLAHACSAIDITRNVIVGRPYGGTAILFRKEMAGCIRQIDTGDPRLCAVSLMCNIESILFVCVYMPNDTGDYECVENYIDTCARLSAIFC
jgi:exonuclease III